MSKRTVKMKKIFIIILLIVVSFYLRLNLISEMEYKGEEAMYYNIALKIAQAKDFPLAVMPTAAGVPNAPLFVYIIALFVLIGKTPVGATVCIASLNALAVIVFYLFIWKRVSNFIALSSSFLLATTPWAVIFSRKIWNPDLVAPFSIFLMISAYKVFEEKKTIFWVPLFLSLIALFQLHYAALFLIVAIPLIMGKPSKKDIKYIVSGLILCVISFLSMAIYVARNLACVTHEFMMGEKEFLPLYLKLFSSAKDIIQMMTGLAMFRVLGNDLPSFNSFIGIPELAQAVYFIAVIFFVIGVAYAVRNMENFLMRYSIIVLSLAILYIVLIIPKTRGYYFLVLYPIPFLLISWGAESFKKIGACFIVILILINIYFTYSFQRFIHINNGSVGDYQIPYCNQSRHA